MRNILALILGAFLLGCGERSDVIRKEKEHVKNELVRHFNRNKNIFFKLSYYFKLKHIKGVSLL